MKSRGKEYKIKPVFISRRQIYAWNAFKTYSACGQFAKNKERIQKFKETGDSRYIYQKELDKACFQNDVAHGNFKDLTTRRASEKILHNKAFNIA